MARVNVVERFYDNVRAMHLLLERATRPGLLGVAGRKIEKQCTRDLAAYFKRVGRSIRALNLETVVDGHTSAETARATAVMRLGNIVRNASPRLSDLLKVNIEAAMLAADKLDYYQEADKAVPSDYVGLSALDAADYALATAAELVKGINKTTIEDVADAVASGIEDQLGVPGTARLIRGVVDGMSTSRAEMIASTEMNDAFSEAALRKMDRLGIEYKQIILSDDACVICQDNADEDPIPVDDSYPSGDDRPPFHPNCRCAITGARAPDEGDDSEE